MDALVNLFAQQEVINFSKYNYLKDSMAEHFRLKEEIAEVEAEIEKYKQ